MEKMMEKVVRGIIITVFILCIANLIPYLMIILMLFPKDGSNTYNIFAAIKALFEIPTSLVLFIVKESIGEFFWILTNIILLVISFLFLKN